ncbi:monocarboxylate transporter [Holotrichia oblita]|uniref:Monocarboxylate transporter n=1 Tax=Holotrichia oblita TaxID=644536 RepID=A0ACB9TA78_HOLOL|nr:monocarboxylate transporter [Holotrichia oblita]
MGRSTFLSKNNNKYELIPPDGGWGYVITGAIGLAFVVGFVPISVFVTVFGPFLATLGDETSATTLITGVYSTGIFLTGFGFGLVFPATIASFTQYFVKKQTSMMSVIQVITGAAGIVWPSFTSILLEKYGFRGTVAIFSAISLHGILAVLTLQPAKWHYKRKEFEEHEKLKPQNSGLPGEKEQFLREDTDSSNTETTESWLNNTKVNRKKSTDENVNTKTGYS